MSQQATEQFRQYSKPARTVFGHTHFTNPDSGFVKNQLYATWCQTSELHEKLQPSTSTKQDSGSNVEALPFTLLLSTIGLGLISSLMGNSCFFFSLVCMLSA